MESGGKSSIVSGSQEVIGSIPICSTQRIKGLQTWSLRPFLFCQNFTRRI